ncbi:gamma carbonic anhydrase family protein [Oxalobacteraceae bacterium R-40]|uniref:Gamma carbonic anhydrase family protein n=1 Tax=Keguizhuia sedimenti TaxID=3064264 RepID=A0ABU1BS79_9BURK|nr:gamma carbonic anhydrase family protein [Oxalobacteraceae bacterium R-40]
MAIYQLGEDIPDIHSSCYVTESACVVGNVTLKEDVNVWFGASLRADNDEILIGKGSNIQENAVLHADPGFPLRIGNHVSIGHMAMVHGCTIGDGSLIGIQAVILNGARIGKNCLVGAGALVTEGKEFPDNSLIIGSPAKAIRILTEEDIARLHAIAANYVERSQFFKANLKRIA